MVTIFETLENAKANILNVGAYPVTLNIGKRQLYNAVTLLEKGYKLDEIIDPFLEKYEDVDEAPEVER